MNGHSVVDCLVQQDALHPHLQSVQFLLEHWQLLSLTRVILNKSFQGFL
jgi:hypothetical protein